MLKCELRPHRIERHNREPTCQPNRSLSLSSAHSRQSPMMLKIVRHIAMVLPMVGIQTVGDDICFYYTDSGAPAQADYATLFIIHGLIFHSGTFSRISSAAPSHGLRIICVNRREYPGTSPYSPEELKIINEGSSSERAKFMLEQGIHLCLLVDRLVDTLSLPKGGITITGWSLGTIFAIAMMTAINDLPEDTRERLKAHVHKLIIWDPASICIGTNGPPGFDFSFFDTSIPPKARWATFGVWVSSYFKHEDLSLRDFNKLGNDADPTRQATVLGMTTEEISAAIDWTPGDKYDATLVSSSYVNIHWDSANKALFDPACREAWGGYDVWHIYGDANCWAVLHAVWSLEERAKGKDVNFKLLKGANHFPMWEEPERMLLLLKECINGGQSIN
ncbi:Alpha/Beta hydrolase protein [Gymnopilus junonius]|uniref:Alpha/Beta hydrolase protein n=1 Tax=Gymnopilus junonius TaxID=109634 RepID=A0A9P5TFN3_GYMJU|nr:Alpha/Beta hydrolase protein [Gymnopilus junonius]